jgi:serine/threonine protein phosphatase 1
MSLPTYLDLGDIWLAHAGVDPKLSPSEQTAAQLCWIRDEFHTITEPYFCNKLIIIGHTITFTLPGINPGQLAKGCGWLGIDTGVYHPRSGWLTGLDTTNNVVYQVNTLNRETRTLTLEGASARIKW